MNILMMTNTYLPHVGGVAQSVHRFAQQYRRKKHETVVVAPEFSGAEESEPGVVRVPAVQNFNGSDFSVVVPVPFYLTRHLKTFSPDVVHSHHPFLLGSTALRVAALHEAPLVFTHHTMYEHYTHYVPLEARTLKKFVIQLCTGYANRCNQVIAPSSSVREVLVNRGVETPITVIPTGVDVESFSNGDGSRTRDQCGIGSEDFVIGHVGRLAPEKNLDFLAQGVARFLNSREDAVFIVAGTGPSQEAMLKVFQGAGVAARVHFAGKLAGQELVDFYHAMDVFAFASKSETQGMVLVEAMAAGVPVVALDASGVRDVLAHEKNGWMVSDETAESFAEGLGWIADRTADEQEALAESTRETGRAFSTTRCAEKALKVYRDAIEHRRSGHEDSPEWLHLLHSIEQEWHIWSNRIAAAASMVQDAGSEQE